MVVMVLTELHATTVPMNSNINYVSYIFSLWSQKFEKIQNKMGSTGCKWSSLDAPGTESPLSHSGWENSISSFSWSHPYWELGEFPFLIISPLVMAVS